MSIMDDLLLEQEEGVQAPVTPESVKKPSTKPTETSAFDSLIAEQGEAPKAKLKEVASEETTEEDTIDVSSEGQLGIEQTTVSTGVSDDTDLMAIGANGESPSIRQKAMFDAYMRAGNSGFDQLRGFGATALRGTLQTGRRALAFPLNLVVSVMESAAPGSIDKLHNYMYRRGAPREDTLRQTPTLKALAQYWSGDIPTEAERDGVQAFEDDLSTALKGGGVPAAAAVAIATGAWQTSITLIAAKAITGKLPGGATGRGANWKDTVKHAGKFAALAYVKTPGTPEEKAETAAMSFMYVATPAISMNIPSDALAKVFDFVLNSGITLATGQWGVAVEQAKLMAEDQGSPDEWQKYMYATATPMVVSDALFSMGTKSRASQDAAIGRKLSALLKIPALNALTKISPLIERGDLSGVDIREAIKNLTITRVDEMGVDASRSQELKAMLEEPYKFNTNDEMKKIADPAPSVDPTSSRTLARLKPEQRITEEFSAQDIRFESKGELKTEKVTEMMNDAVKRNRTVIVEFKDGKMVVTDGVARLEAKRILREKVNVRVVRGEDSLKDVDPDVQAARAALDGRSLTRPNIERVRRNAGLILDTIPRSAVATNRAKQEAIGKKDQSIILEENIGRVLKQMDTIQHSPEDFGKALDSALSNVGGPANSTQLRARIMRTGTISSADLDAHAVSLGKTGDVPRRDLSMDELREFAIENKISIPGGPLKEKDLIRDIMEVSNNYDNPEHALQALNELNQLKGRPLITDINSEVAGGSIIRPDERYKPTDVESKQIFDSMPESLKMDTIGQKAIEDAIEHLDHPIPKDPADQRVLFGILNKIALQTNRAQHNTETEIQNRGWDLINKSNLAGSMRYVFGDMSVNTGDANMFSLYRSVDLQGRRSTFSVETRMDEVFKRAGLVKGNGKTNMDMKWYILSHPDLGHAMKVVIGTNPDKPTPELTEAIKLLSSDKNADKLNKLTESISQELQGVTATNVRTLQTYEFGKMWDSTIGQKTFGQKYIELERLGKDRTDSQSKEFGVLEAKLSAVLPMKSENGKGVQVSKEEMIQADRVFKTEGREALRDHLDKSTWGTRKNYWMSESEYQAFGLEPNIKGDLPTHSKPKASMKIKTAGEINSRTGYSKLQEGDIFASLFTHANKLQRQADTYHDTNALKAKIDFYRNEGLIPEDVYDGMKQWTESQWGRFQKPGPVTKGLIKANAVFWTVYPLALTRLAWYSARNIMYQGAIYGPLNTHFRAGDVMQNYPKMIRDYTDPSSRINKYLSDVFKSDISQQSAIFFEQMLGADPGTVTPSYRLARVRLQRLWSLCATLLGGSDTLNRLIVGGTAYSIIDKHVTGYINNAKTNMGNVFDALKINTMHIAQQRRLYNMFRDADGKDRDAPEWELFTRELAEMKQENINFVYRIAGKSPMEQTPTARPLLGILTYQRGTYEELYRNGLEPIVKEADVLRKGGTVDWKAVKNGGGVLASSVITHAISSAVGGFIIGEKDDPKSKEDKTVPTYSLRDTLSWSPGSPGMHLSNDFIGEGQDLAESIFYNNDTQMKRSLNFFIGKGIYFTPMLPTLRNVMESAGNAQAVRNIDQIIDFVNDTDKEVQRNAWEKWLQHPMFDTADVHDERYDLPLLKGFGTRLLDSETMFVKPIRSRLEEE